MRTFIYALPITVAFGLFAPAYSQQATALNGASLSLAEAEARLVDTRQMLISDADIEAREFERQALDNLNLPQVSITIAGIAYEKDISFTIPLLNQPADLDVSRSGLRSQVTMLWPLYTGGRAAASQAIASARVTEGEAEQRILQLQLVKRLSDLYFSQQMMQQVVAVRQQTQQTIAHHANRAARFKEQGLITELGEMQAQVALAEARRELIAAQRQTTDIQAALANLLEITPNQCLTTQLPTPSPLSYDPSWFVSRAKQHNPVFAQLAAKQQQVQQMLVIEQGKRLPELFFAASYDLNRSATPLTEPDWSVGLGMRYHFTTAVDVGASINSAGARARQLDLTKEQANNDIQLAVESAYRAVQEHQEQFELLQTDIELSRQHAEMQSKAFAEGLATSLEVTDAQLRLAATQVRALNSAFLYTTALAHLTQLSGQPELLTQLAPSLNQQQPCALK